MATMTTGWPTPHLMQDDCRKLSIWFATRLGARYVYKKGFGHLSPRIPRTTRGQFVHNFK